MENSVDNVNNALNELSLALNFSLFHLAHSPLLIILNKMASFDSFGAYLAEASDSSTAEFVPDLLKVDKPSMEGGAV